MISILLYSFTSFLLGIISYRFYQARLIRYLPEQGKLKVRALLCENIQQSNQDLPIKLILSLENFGESDIHLESWFFRTLNGRGYLRQLFYFPQNLVRTLKPGEKTSIEILDLSFLEGHSIYTIIIRDIYGREWELKKDEIHNLKKDLFWQNI
ncbi:MAG: hypothetical protein K9K67_03325 [Bacteriovoracaceae bacterium]|nr:hypothetical protein [Bacteriovoracaceae bacterium]